MAERGRASRQPRPVRRVQRVAAYAVILRDEQILLSRLAGRVTGRELWTLPGGGVEHGENPRDAVVREVHEETGLAAWIGETAHVYSLHQRDSWRHGRRADAHALRIVYDGWVPTDSPEPHVVEIGGSTAEAAWKPLAAVLNGTIPTVSLVAEALAEHRAHRVQRTAAYALVLRNPASAAGPEVLLTRISHRGAHAGSWTLPGGGVEHGEDPRIACRREVTEECGLDCLVGEALDVDAVHFEGTGPSGRQEDYHGIHLVFDATLGDDAHAEPQVSEVDGTTDRAAWVPVADVRSGRLTALPLVVHTLDAHARRHGLPGTIGT